MQYPTNSYLFIGIFPSQNGYQDDMIRRIFVALQSTRCSQKKTKPENFYHNFIHGSCNFIKFGEFFQSLLRTQLQLHFKRSLCNTLT